MPGVKLPPTPCGTCTQTDCRKTRGCLEWEGWFRIAWREVTSGIWRRVAEREYEAAVRKEGEDA